MSQEGKARRVTRNEKISIRRPRAERLGEVEKPIRIEGYKSEPLTLELPKPVMKITLKEAVKVGVGDIKIPNICLRKLSLFNINVIPTEVLLTEPLALKLKLSLAKKIIRLPVSEPLAVKTYLSLKLKIRAKPLHDISIRPLIKPGKISLIRLLITPSLKISPLPTLRSEIFSPTSVEQPLLLRLNLRLPIQLPRNTAKTAKEVPKRKETVHEVKEKFELSLPEGLLDEQYLDEEYYKLGGLGGVSAEGLVCILVEKYRDFHEFIKLLCAKMWRIKGRGLPSVAHRGYGSELSYHGLEEDIIELSKASELLRALAQDYSKVKVIDDAREELRRVFEKEIKSKSIEGRLRFILIPIEGKEFERAYQILTGPKLGIERYLKHARFFAYKLKRVDEEFLWRMLISAFGFAETPIHSPSIGEYALELEGKFYRKLEEIIAWTRRKIEPINWPKPGDEGGQPESWLHWALKHLAYAHLICNEGVNEGDIKSEEIIIEDKVTDVICRTPDRLIAIEIETMYGTGDPVGAKINPRTLKPYLEGGFNGELWLLIPNLHALLYVSDLLRLRESYRKRGLKLEIHIADVTGLGAELIYGERRNSGLIKLIDVLKFTKQRM